MRVTLLGPQRRVAAARAAVRELIPAGPIATINAGWQERESQTGELGDVLGGRMRNLELFARWQRLLGDDPGYADAERHLFDLVDDLQSLYAVRLHHALAAWHAVRRRTGVPAARAAALDDALEQVRALDRWQLQTVAEARHDFYRQVGIGERASVVEQRRVVADLTADCAGFVITGGHVGVLLHVLHLFDARTLITAPLITWSAGAMACSERVVLYNDYAADGPMDPQVYADGLGLFPHVLPFPHPRRRLRLDDHERLDVMAKRFAPMACVLLSDGERVDVDDHGELPADVRVLEVGA